MTEASEGNAEQLLKLPGVRVPNALPRINLNMARTPPGP